MLPVRSAVAICGGGDIQKNRHTAALYDYDATLPAMREIVAALFADPSYPADETYVRRRYESSIVPGAWESLAAARFRRPGLEPPATPSSERAYQRITVPVLVVEGAAEKLCRPGGRPRSPGRSAAASRPSSRGPGTARRSSSPRWSATCCWRSLPRRSDGLFGWWWLGLEGLVPPPLGAFAGRSGVGRDSGRVVGGCPGDRSGVKLLAAAVGDGQLVGGSDQGDPALMMQSVVIWAGQR